MVRLYLFRCPNTGIDVQASHEGEESGQSDDGSFKMVECLACGRIHLVNPASGKLMSDRES